MNTDIDISNVILKTKRLTLRSWKLSDLDDLYEYAKVPDVGERAGWNHHQNKEESLFILNKFVNDKKTFAIEYNGKVIGSIGIEKYDENEFPDLVNLRGREIGYVLSKDYWGMGIMTEAVKEVIKYLFEKEGLDFIVCGHFLENERSHRVQEKCDFKHVKRIKFMTRMNIEKESWLAILWRNEYNPK